MSASPPGMAVSATPRYPLSARKVITGPVHSLTATVSNNQITIGGTVAVPQNPFVLIVTMTNS
jgi:hypothetical protein